MMKDLYDELGVEKTAKPEDIKKAYRKRSKETHPDKAPEKTEQFLAIQRAYDILSDDRKRERYDSMGSQGPSLSMMQEMARDALGKMLIEIIEAADMLEMIDPVAIIKQKVKNGIEIGKLQIETIKELAEQRRKKFTSAAAKLKRKKNGDDVLIKILLAESEKRPPDLAHIQDQIDMAQIMLTMIDEYQFEVGSDGIIRTGFPMRSPVNDKRRARSGYSYFE